MVHFLDFCQSWPFLEKPSPLLFNQDKKVDLFHIVVNEEKVKNPIIFLNKKKKKKNFN